jgi:hypothetical protein
MTDAVARSLLEALVRPVFVEVTDIDSQHRAGVAPIVDQQTIGALLPDAAHEPLRVAVRRGVRGGVTGRPAV